MDLSLYESRIQEKIERICDILVQMNKISLLRDTLCFYGGTALNFIFLKAPRLSEDLDFNYRHIEKKDWGKVRNDIDNDIKRILKDLKYVDDEIKIQPFYPLGRFYIKYRNTMRTIDNIKIEIGYLRRMSILENDMFNDFKHPITNEKIQVKTPVKEELFANKFCTFFSRELMRDRDLYDIFNISREEFDVTTFVDIVMVESIFMNINIIDSLLYDNIETTDLKELQNMVLKDIDINKIKTEAKKFIIKIQDILEDRSYSLFLDDFLKNDQLNQDFLRNPDLLNKEISKHPALLWAIEQKNKGSSSEV